jgi:threonine/homoserine/homoserine lactone efflux protein
MNITPFVAGLAIGLAVAAPLGPVNLMVIRATLAGGRVAGLLVAAGAVLADVLLASAAAFGLKALGQWVAGQAHWWALAGGLLMIAVGIQAARKTVHNEEIEAPTHWGAAAPHRNAGLAFTLTVSNPGSLLGFIALLAGMAPALNLGAAPWRPVVLVVAIGLGGGLWWLFITTVAAVLRRKLSAGSLSRINRWAGIIIASFGFLLLFEGLKPWTG